MAQHLTLGVRFGIDACKMIQREYRDLINTTGTEQDYYEGTDATLWGVPIDFTYHFNGKDYTDELLHSNEWIVLPCGILVKIGVRTGNAHHDFEKPVLVVGLSCDYEELKANYKNALYQFVNRCQFIFELAFDRYWDWCDAHDIAY